MSYPDEPHNVARGSVLRARRVERGLTVLDVALLAEVPAGVVEEIEAETRRDIGLRQRISDALGTVPVPGGGER